MKHVILAAAAALALGACASGAKTGAMIVPVGNETLIADGSPLRNAVSVADVKGGKETSPLWKSNVSNEAFMEALRQSLSVHTMLAGGHGKYRLTAELQKLEQPLIGFDMTVTSHIRYTLTDVASGATVFEKLITTPYKAEMSDAFLGVKRLQLANEGSIRANIKSLIQTLIVESTTNPALKADGQKLISQLEAIAKAA